MLSYYRLSCIETSRQKKKIQEFEWWGDFEISVSKLQQNNTSQREREGIERERKEKRDFLNNLYSFDSY